MTMLSFDAGFHDITAVCFDALGYEVVDSKITVTPSATEHRGVIGIWCAVLPLRKNTEIDSQPSGHELQFWISGRVESDISSFRFDLQNSRFL